MDTFCILLVSTIILLVAWVRTRLNSQSTEDLPPGSMGLPLIGETVEFVKKKVCEIYIYIRWQERLTCTIFYNNMFIPCQNSFSFILHQKLKVFFHIQWLFFVLFLQVYPQIYNREKNVILQQSFSTFFIFAVCFFFDRLFVCLSGYLCKNRISPNSAYFFCIFYWDVYITIWFRFVCHLETRFDQRIKSVLRTNFPR